MQVALDVLETLVVFFFGVPVTSDLLAVLV